jgi:UDP-glucose 4-epimerase
MGKILVTGGAGFIGIHLVERLLRDHEGEVTILDNLKRSAAERVAHFPPRARLVVGDIRDFDAVAREVRGCDVVYHLAAQSNVMGAVTDPDYSVTTNVLGTHNVLRAAAEAGVPRLVFTSSREAYGEPDRLPVEEARPLLPKSGYGASKAAGEFYARAFSTSHPIAIEIVRFANVYGAGDSGRVIPLWVAAAKAGRDLEVYGGEQVIDFLWVGTAVEALVHAARRGLQGPTNIGSGVGTRILDLADRILAVTGSTSKIKRTPARKVEVARFVADTTHMRAQGLVPEADPLQHLGEIVGSY